MSIFFIFDRVMYYKIKQSYTQKKFVSVEVKQLPSVTKNRKPGKRLAAQVSKRGTTTGGKVSNIVKS